MTVVRKRRTKRPEDSLIREIADCKKRMIRKMENYDFSNIPDDADLTDSIWWLAMHHKKRK